MKLAYFLRHVSWTACITSCLLILETNFSTSFAADAAMPPSAKAPPDPKDVKQITPPVEKTDSALTFRVSAPLWVSAISGNVGVRGRVTPAAYIPFNDIFSHLDYAIPGNIEVGYGKWGALLDGQFTKLSDMFNTRDQLFQPATIQMQQAFAEFNLSYKAIETDKLSVSPFIGTRFEYVKLGGQFGTTGKIAGTPKTFDESKETQWADPILGFQAQYQVLKPTKMVAKADVGGFGAASKLTYQFYIGAQTQITRSVYADVGYRYLQTNYTDGGFTYNMAFSGPQIAFGVNF